MALLRGKGHSDQRGGSKPRITPKNTRRVIGVARIVLPVAAPLAFQAAAFTRDRWDRMRASRLGIPVDRLPEFTGHGAALHVRICGLGSAVGELRADHPDQAEFATSTERRLTDLGAAVRAAERMPRERRRAAHRAVATELDAVESGLLQRLGVLSNRPR
jgi:hypothetical protein